jgi:hypothetical protein
MRVTLKYELGYSRTEGSFEPYKRIYVNSNLLSRRVIRKAVIAKRLPEDTQSLCV